MEKIFLDHQVPLLVTMHVYPDPLSDIEEIPCWKIPFEKYFRLEIETAQHLQYQHNSLQGQ